MNIFVKQYKTSKRACPDLEPVEFLLTGLDRPVEILDLTGKNSADSNTIELVRNRSV
jgi:hypothetical protein